MEGPALSEWCIRLGLLTRVAYHTLRAYVGASLGEPDAVPEVVSLAQSFGALAHWHPHLHLVVTDGAFRRDGTFAASPAHDAAVLAEAWRRAVLSLFVREGWFDEDTAARVLAWPHSGFGAHVGAAIAADDRAAVLRMARYGARASVAESRLRHDAERGEVELASEAREGPYAGVHRFAAVEFLDAQVLERESEPWPALKARRRRWAELLRRVFPVDVTVCARCGGEMRILGFVTKPAVVRRILAHLESKGVDARAGRWAGAVLAAE